MYAVPTEMSVVLKEHFNRWYTLKSYYLSVIIIDIPLSVSIKQLRNLYFPESSWLMYDIYFRYFAVCYSL